MVCKIQIFLLIVFTGTLGPLLGIYSFVAAQTSCVNPSPIPSGFAAPCPVFSAQSPSSGTNASITLSPISGAQAHYIYAKVYVAEQTNTLCPDGTQKIGGAWCLVSLQLTQGSYEPNTQNVYIAKNTSAQATLPLSGFSQGSHWVVEWDWNWNPNLTPPGSSTPGCYEGPGGASCYVSASNMGGAMWRVQSVDVSAGTPSGGATINVTPFYSYSKIEAANPGDTVVFAPGTYHFRLWLNKLAGTTPITLKAQDPNNRPIFDYSGQPAAQLWPGSYNSGDAYRGCWLVTGTGYVIDGFIIKGCAGIDGNSAGIRFLKGSAFTARHMLFQGNQMGVEGGGDGIVIEYSEFDHNGNLSNDQSHNIYVLGGANFTLRYSYVHDALGGQNFHMRARNAVLEYNWFANAADYEGDMMTAGTTYDSTPPANNTQSLLLRGNVFVTNPMSGNQTKVLTLFNDNLLPGVTMNLTAVWNTFIVNAAGTVPALIQIRNDTLAAGNVIFSNNIVAGATRTFMIVQAPTTLNYSASGVNNFFVAGSNINAGSDLTVPTITNTVFGASPGFTNEAARDYTLTLSSPAIGAANVTVANPPAFQSNLIVGALTTNARASISDIGALNH